MKVGRFATHLKYSLLGAFVLAGLWPIWCLPTSGMRRTR